MPLLSLRLSQSVSRASASQVDWKLQLLWGADLALNVQSADVDKVVNELTNGLGADAVFECSGAAPSPQNCLELVRRHGRYAQVGLFGKTIQWDMDLACYKEVELSNSFATVPASWPKALALMGSVQVQTSPLISHTMPIAEWQEAFETFERRDGLKIVLTPGG